MSKHIIIQISDCHLKADKNSLIANVNPYQRLQQIIREIQLEKPELVILTGDIADEGDNQAYKLAQELLTTLACKVYCIPGNHDNPSNMERYLFAENILNHRVINLEKWHFILLNSQLQHEVFGILSAAELDFLADQLEQSIQKKVAIFLHHPPLKINFAFFESIMLLNNYNFHKVIEAYENIGAIFFGHIHQGVANKYKQIDYYACPSTAFQFIPEGETILRDLNRVGYRKIMLEGNNLTTEVKWL